LFLRKLFDYNIFSPMKKIGVYFLSKTNVVLWAKLHNGQKLKVDLSSTVGRSIYLRGCYEYDVEKELKKNLNPGDVFFDIGANVGYFTLTSQELVGEKGEVHSFEPHDRAFSLLQESVKSNKCDNIFLNKTALSDKEKAVEFVSLKDSAFSWTQQERNNSSPSVTIKTTTLDKYINDINLNRKIKSLKIDVEGAEYNVLLGAKELLMSQSPYLILEVQDWSLSRFGYSVDDIFTFLDKCGYRAFDLDGNSVLNAAQARQHLQKQWVKNLLFKKD